MHKLIIGLMVLAPLGMSQAEVPDFTAEVQPILAAHCTQCHGPEKQKNGLRLDSPDGLRQGGDTGALFIAEKSGESLLYQVVAGLHEDISMPPKGEKLDEAALATLKAWIDGGAVLPEADGARAEVVSDHWAYQPITSPALPTVTQKDWVIDPIDSFVLHTMEEQGVVPSPVGERVILMRRLYLDLIGLPPTPEEVATYMADESSDAYARLVDRLLASEHYGERWGRHWLDLARYADSDGYEKDTFRPWAWRYRNWVIDALNADMPYDQFVTEQLAGDLLPDATLEQKIATGFHRNTLTNKEGGVDQEEFRIAQVVDRTNTTYQAFMGITMNCAQCHTHKYDPITIREFYESMAFFNVGKELDIAAPLADEVERFKKQKGISDKRIEEAREAIREYAPRLKDKLAAWEETLDVPEKGWEVLSPASYASAGGAEFKKLKDKSLLVKGPKLISDTYTVVARTRSQNIKALRLEALTDDFLASNGPGRADNGNFMLTDFKVKVMPLNKPEDKINVKFSKAKATFEQKEHTITNAFDDNLRTGWAIFRGAETNQNVSATFWFETPVEFKDGVVFRFNLDHQYGNKHTLGRFRLSLITIEPDEVPYSDALHQALLKPVEERSNEEQELVLAYFSENDPDMKGLQGELDKLIAAAPKAPDTQAQTIVADSEPPTTYIHQRGNFMRKGEQVAANTPAVFPALVARGETPDRLDFARWLTGVENPLASRVAVNRVWDKLFGDGLVRTPEDFGVRGEVPTHPELLDWMARDFMKQGWGQKALIRQIVSSNTYKQSSNHRSALADKDPQNRLLARQNRFRVEAEITRDLFLSASDLLNKKVGGPSVRPPLPEGFANLGYANSIKFDESKGDEKYRRGIYIQFQRTIAYPMLMTFDCPDSNTTNIKRSRSNTPLQALTLLNDPVFVECAEGLGARILTQVAGGAEARVKHAFQICMAREPGADELAALTALLEQGQRYYNENPKDAAALLTRDVPAGVEPAEAAAYMNLARAILNLDEFLTRE